MAGLHQRPIRHFKGQPRDDHVAQPAPTDIHALPETVGAQQHRALIIAESLEQQTRRTIGPVDQHGEFFRQQQRPQRLGHLAEHRETGEQHERPAIGVADQLMNPWHDALHIIRVIRLGQIPVDDQFHLRGVIEGAAQLQGLRAFTPQTRSQVRKIARAGGERRRSDHNRNFLVEQALRKNRRHIHRNALQGHSRRTAANPPLAAAHPFVLRVCVCAFQPVDAALEFLLQQRFRL